MLAVAGLSVACGGKIQPPEPRAVGVGVDEMSTRAMFSTEDDILSLGIFGYSTGTDNFDSTNPEHTPNLFENASAGRATASSDWEYDPVAIWPSNNAEKNTFFAYAPYMADGAVGTDGAFEVPAITSGAPVIKYRVPLNVSEQVDLLYSEYVTTDANGVPTGLNSSVANIDAGTNAGKVLYKMKHAMLWIRFLIATEKMEPAEPTESYTITEFRFIGGNIMAAAAFDLATGTWSADPTFAGTSDGYEGAEYEFDYLSDTPRTITAGNAERLGAALSNSYLMIIPDNFVTGVNETSVELSYTHYDGSGTPSQTEYFVTLPFPDVQVGKPGYMMTYVVKVSTNGAYIEFQDSNTIEKWLEDETERGIDVY
jgi:hypothetical protein